jgi:Tfp pilus assembly protein PilV
MQEEFGYSLVEVMVSIILLTVAILPMVGMFDMGLNSATDGSQYDKARTLANLKMEEAKSLTYATVKNGFPVTGSTPDSTTGYYDSGFIAETGPASAEFTNFEYRVEKQYMKQPDPTFPDFRKCSVTPNSCNASSTGPIRIIVTVQWDDGNNDYQIFGLVT